MNNHSGAAKPAVQLLHVDADLAGQRIDNFLTRYLKGVPKTRIYRILRKGEVRVNKGRVRPAYRLQAGDQVRIPPVRVSDRSTSLVGVGRFAWLEDQVLLETDTFLVLNKPAGMAVHGGSGISLGVIEALRGLRPQSRYLELVHRLDRDTSGCLLLAKRRSSLRDFHQKFRDGEMEKHYTALVKGDWRGGRRAVKEPLRKNQLSSGERIVRVDPLGKSCTTWFKPLEHYHGATLLEARLGTGRTHQIRVHGACIDHPLAGDEKYGEREFNRSMHSMGLRRLFLHAHFLGFSDPVSGKPVRVEAPLGKELLQLLKKLQR